MTEIFNDFIKLINTNIFGITIIGISLVKWIFILILLCVIGIIFEKKSRLFFIFNRLSALAFIAIAGYLLFSGNYSFKSPEENLMLYIVGAFTFFIFAYITFIKRGT